MEGRPTLADRFWIPHPCGVKAFAKKPATVADLSTVPDTMVAELIAGELLATPRPAAPHARAASALGAELFSPFDRGRGGPGGWWIIDEPELHLSEDVLVPEIAGWRRETMAVFPSGAFFTVRPDWICEVISCFGRSETDPPGRSETDPPQVELWRLPLLRWPV